MAVCTNCRQPFQAKFASARLCLSCWKKQRDEEMWQQGWRVGYDVGHEEGWQAGYEEGKELGRTMLSRKDQVLLLQLAHPDRHPESRREPATRAAQLINSLAE